MAEISAAARRDRDEVVRALDRIRDKVEQWGVVTISAPVAVLDETAFYVPYDIVAPETAYDQARTDVEAVAVQATERVVQNSADVTLTPTGIPGLAAPPAGGTSTSSMTSTVTAPSIPPVMDSSGKSRASLDSSTNSTPSFTAAKALASEQATKPFELLAGTPAPTKSVSAAVREAEDNTIRQKIYSAMSHPQKIPGYNHVIFVIVQVSCNPGWRTQEHYIADCSASFEYFDFATKQHLSRAERRAPTVFAVLPLVDAQTVEMANSQREVTQLAFQLAASLPAKGVDIKGKDLFEFVKRYSRDLRSRTPIPVVNSYSSGGTFGFRFSPSFQAMKDPAQKNSQAANVLLPTTFPALITVVVNDDDYRCLHYAQPAILTHTLTRWFLKDRPPLWQFPKRLFTPMRRDTAGMEIDLAQDVGRVYAAKSKFKENSGDPETEFNPMFEEMRRQIIALEEKGIGRDWPILLPRSFGSWDRLAKNQAAENQRLQSSEEAKRKARAAASPKKDTTAISDVGETGSFAADSPVFNQRFGMVPTSELAAAGSFSTLPLELSPSIEPSPHSSARRASLHPDVSQQMDGENPLLPTLPEP